MTKKIYLFCFRYHIPTDPKFYITCVNFYKTLMKTPIPYMIGRFL